MTKRQRDKLTADRIIAVHKRWCTTAPDQARLLVCLIEATLLHERAAVKASAFLSDAAYQAPWLMDKALLAANKLVERGRRAA